MIVAFAQLLAVDFLWNIHLTPVDHSEFSAFSDGGWIFGVGGCSNAACCLESNKNDSTELHDGVREVVSIVIFVRVGCLSREVIDSVLGTQVNRRRNP